MTGQTYTQTGQASFYASKFEGRMTANGEIFTNTKMTAAHKELPFGSKVKVTNLENQKSIIVTITDRGPFIKGRIIDVSQKAAKELGFYNQGITSVKIEVIPTQPDKYPLAPLKPKAFENFLISNLHIEVSSIRLKQQAL